MSDDGWSDDEKQTPKFAAPTVIGTYRVIEDYLPETNAHLTLILDDLVYVFRKSGPGLPEGFWEGETLGVTGIFPAKHVEINKTLDQEIAGCELFLPFKLLRGSLGSTTQKEKPNVFRLPNHIHLSALY